MGVGTVCVDFRFYQFSFDPKYKSVYFAIFSICVWICVECIFNLCMCEVVLQYQQDVCVRVCVNERLILQCVHASSPSRLICISASHHVA